MLQKKKKKSHVQLMLNLLFMRLVLRLVIIYLNTRSIFVKGIGRH